MPAITRRLTSALQVIVFGVCETYRLAGKTFISAPILPALVIAPEFAQHIAEITMGMFDSHATAHALGRSALRLGFGYVKLAGLALSALLTARFWANGQSLRRAVLIRPQTLAQVIIALVVLAGGGEALVSIARHLSRPANIAFQSLSAIFQVSCLVWLVGKLIEDPIIGLRQAFTTRFPTGLLMAMLLGPAIVPAQFIHAVDHKLAIAAPNAVVWSLMTLDAFIVGAMAALVGSALYIGYRPGATWQGWSGAAPT